METKRDKHWGVVEWAALLGIPAAVVTVLAFVGIKMNEDVPPPATVTTSPPQSTSPPESTSPTTTTSSRPTKQQYIATADGVCVRHFQMTASIDATLEQGTPEHIQEVLAVWDSMLNEWAALPAPRGHERLVDPIIDSEREAWRYMQEGLEAATAGDASTWRSLEAKADQAQRTAADRAREYGFRVCSRT